MVRIVRIAVSFAAVFCAYLAYAALAVPLIEPPAEEPDVGRGRPARAGQSSRESSRWRQELAELLPAALAARQMAVGKGQDPAPARQLQLVFWEYETRAAAARCEIRPCVIIYTPERTRRAAETSLRQAVVLEAPDGAMLEFDEPLNLSSMKVGRLKGGSSTGGSPSAARARAPARKTT